ncbi:MAG TPA: hypothetical protein VKS60_01910 [Stellaceae bacterium]|nr:hypothetical protein [Stellaceae bacterium]
MADSAPADGPLLQTWRMLLNGYGYNWYREENLARADDLLVRSRASDHLAAAAARLRELEAGYRRRHIPPPSRAQPDPDPDHLAAARRIRAAHDRILSADTVLRGAPVPPTDRIWARFSAEPEMLKRLVYHDVMLVGSAEALESGLAGLDAAAGLDDAREAEIDRHLTEIAAALKQRRDLLEFR